MHARNQLLYAGLRNGSSLHVGDARPCRRSNIVKRLNEQYQSFLEKHEADGWNSLEDFRGSRRDRVVSQSKIRRPDSSDYNAGYEAVEGYAAPAEGEREAAL